MTLPASYSNGFAPRDGMPRYPSLWRGCVGAWAPCLGPSGLMLRDWSGFGNHGTLTNMDAAGDWVSSSGRYALDFDGSNDYVTSPFALLRGESFKTMSIWINPITTASNAQFDGYFGAQQNTTSRFGITNAGSIAGNDDVLLLCGNGLSSTYGYTTTGVLVNNTMSHFFLQFDGAQSTNAGRLRLWKDGIEVALTYSGTIPSTLPSATGTALFFGSVMSTGPSLCILDDAMVHSSPIGESGIRLLASRRGIAYELAPRRRSRVSVLASLRYNIFTGNVGSLEVIGAS